MTWRKKKEGPPPAPKPGGQEEEEEDEWGGDGEVPAGTWEREKLATPPANAAPTSPGCSWSAERPESSPNTTSGSTGR